MDDPSRRLQEISSFWLNQRDGLRAVALSGLPRDGSQFAEDLEQWSHPTSTLPQANSLLHQAFDSADVLAAMWSVPLHHVPSDYVLMRAMVDNAMRAMWLLEPMDSRERLSRAWLLARDAPARKQRHATNMLKKNPARPSAEDLKATARNALEYTRDLDAAFTKAIGKLPKPELLKPEDFVAAAERHPFHVEDGGAARFWDQLSELVHGSITATEYRQISDPPDGHTRTTRANVEDLAKAAGLVAKFLSAALELYYDRFQGPDPRSA